MSDDLQYCKFYLKGHCARGSRCLFRHNQEVRISSQSGNYIADSDLSTDLCVYFARGKCVKGGSCFFLHPCFDPGVNPVGGDLNSSIVKLTAESILSKYSLKRTLAQMRGNNMKDDESEKKNRVESEGIDTVE